MWLVPPDFETTEDGHSREVLPSVPLPCLPCLLEAGQIACPEAICEPLRLKFSLPRLWQARGPFPLTPSGSKVKSAGPSGRRKGEIAFPTLPGL